jgi:hypothetical protein
MADMELIYCTDSIRIGSHDWRIEVRAIEDSYGADRIAVPMFRRAGDNGPWSYPSDFQGTLPAGLVNFVLQNAVPIGRALS